MGLREFRFYNVPSYGGEASEYGGWVEFDTLEEADAMRKYLNPPARQVTFTQNESTIGFNSSFPGPALQFRNPFIDAVQKVLGEERMSPELERQRIRTP